MPGKQREADRALLTGIQGSRVPDELARRIAEIVHEQGGITAADGCSVLGAVADHFGLPPARMDVLLRHPNTIKVACQTMREIKAIIRSAVAEGAKAIELPDVYVEADDDAWPYSLFARVDGKVVTLKRRRTVSAEMFRIKTEEAWRWVFPEREGGGDYWVFGRDRWVDDFCLSGFYSYASTLERARLLAKRAVFEDVFERGVISEVSGTPPRFTVIDEVDS